MSATTDNYLFLGLPKSGKTTYFSLMVRHLQDAANRMSNLNFKFQPTVVVDEDGKPHFEEITSEFVDDCCERMGKQRWPLKTVDFSLSYSFKLEVKSWLIKRKAVIDYYDYAGEAFEIAFHGRDRKKASEEKFKDFENAAKDMLNRITDAKGIFLILDADAIFNERQAYTSTMKKTITDLFRSITRLNPNVKLAVIFNKLELFGEDIPDFPAFLRKKYGNLYAHLPDKSKFFDVYTVGEITTDENGNILPPKKIKPRNILDPVRWMIDF